jgi:cytoskeletal protein RodZ
MDVGTVLRDARQRAGLSREQVSQRTKIQLAKIDALEANAFERLPEGIYLDGLIRAYATEVGLDGGELLAQVRRSATAAPADHAPAPVAVPLVTPPAAPVIQPAASPAYQPAEVTYTAPALHPPSEATVASAVHDGSGRRGIGRFALPLLALLVAIGFGAYLYDRSRPFGRAEVLTPALSHDNERAAAAHIADAEAAQPIPDDAVPADRPSSTAHHSEEPAQPSAQAERAAAAAPAPAAAPATSRSASTRSDSAPAPVAPEVADARSAPRAPSAPEATSPLSGTWVLDTRVESSSYRGYEGLQLAYRLQLEQQGTRISGEGVKTAENGTPLAARARTPISVSGSIEGDRVVLTFTEHGTQRASGGKMILDRYDDGVLRGRFSSSAARSAGTAEARRPRS